MGESRTFHGEYRKVVSNLLRCSALKYEDFKWVVTFKKDDLNIIRYLKGETLIQEGEKGYTAVCLERYPLGWAKQTGKMLKNLYPKNWRMM